MTGSNLSHSTLRAQATAEATAYKMLWERAARDLSPPEGEVSPATLDFRDLTEVERNNLCIEKGWFCLDVGGKHPRWGCFRPCPPGTPDSRPDHNRLANWWRSGRDDIYEGLT